jgi:WD40 repeat protein
MLMIAQAGIPCKWANESQRFLLEHFDIIKDSPSHVYCSALPFCPSSSWLHKCYSAEFSQEVKVVKGVPAGWGQCSRLVTLGRQIGSLSCWNDAIAVGFGGGGIIILDAVTGSQTATFSSHRKGVTCLVFSSDGRSLVSGSTDETVKLWDMQTGGVVKTFSGHTHWIVSVSISADFATIASGSHDGSIYLWSIHTGKCYCVIKQEDRVDCVRFSPTDPRHLLSVCNGKVWQWNTNGHQAGPTQDGHNIVFSPDGTQLVVCNGESATVQNSSSGVSVTKLYMANNAYPRNCCFSPDGKFVAVDDQSFIHVWDITSLDPHLIETFHKDSEPVSNLVFSSPSSIISVQYEHIKFWQIGSPSTHLAETDSGSTSLISAGGQLIALQAKDGIIITSEKGVLKVWDTLTSLCKASFQIPLGEYSRGHAQLINGGLVFTWSEDGLINLWDVEERKLLWAVDGLGYLYDIKIS